jgi:hypothetical protein
MQVRWDGPSGSVNRDVGAETGEGDVLEHGCVYELSDELAESLVRHDASWHYAEDDEMSQLTLLKRNDLEKVAADAGVENPGRFPNKLALAAAIVAAKGGGS